MSLDEFAEGPPSLGDDTLQLLGQVSTATIQNQLFLRGLRRTVLEGVLPLVAERPRFAGEAFTLRYIPAREDLDVVAAFRDPKHPQRVAVESVPPGHVLVCDSRQDPRAASAGEILVTRLGVRGAAAFVTDGAVRDSYEMAATGIPVFAAGVTPTTNLVLHHAVDIQVPIGCGGVAVYPGDVLVGDEEGVVVIPRHLADEIAVNALEQEELERFLLERVRQGAPVPGTYPPDDVTRAAYARSREETAG
ncbi:MAG: ribonuclease activity regulator RraA [Actinomycetota bacterium]|nr:ribonuclease activity regulator RraA [Actinomycetota bacterium]